MEGYERSFDYEKWVTYIPNFRDTILVPLSLEDISLMLSYSRPFETVSIPDCLLDLQAKVSECCATLPFPWFIRLGSQPEGLERL
jgi:hypothetical protein